MGIPDHHRPPLSENGIERYGLHLSRRDLADAVAAGVIATDHASALWRFLGYRAAIDARPRFDLVHLLWYAGALIVIGAMGLFSTLAFSRFGGGALTATAAVYAVGFSLAGHAFWHRQGMRVPGGLLVTVAVTMAPLATYGVQDALGWWTHGDPGAYRDFFVWIKGSWLPMDLAAVAAGLVALRFYRFPFLIAPIAVALWFMSMDIAPWVLGSDWGHWEGRRLVSLWFGLGVLAVAWTVDVRARGDSAFWLHLFGLLTFWGALSLADSAGPLANAHFALINAGLLFLSVFLQRRAYAVFGAIGIAQYLGYLSYGVFKDSLLFPFALSGIGVAVIGTGLLYYRYGRAIEDWVGRALPAFLSALRPAHARAPRA
ncbi:MAG: hypothetical protein ACT4P2_02765 [Pseudomonadota bacterium]